MKKGKSNRWKSLLILAGVLFVVVGIGILASRSRRTIPNTEGKEGNSACNLYNGGLFCEDEERIYFSNLNDGGALYSMSKELDDFKYIYEDTAGFINNTDAYLVYSRLNYTRSDSVKRVLQFSASGLYRLEKKGFKNIKSLYYSNVGAVVLNGNDVYYQKPEKGGKINLYHSTLSSKSGTVLLEKDVIPGTVRDGKIYYSGRGENHHLYYFDTKTGKEEEVYPGNCHAPALVGEHIYFISLSDGYKLARVDADGKNPVTVVEDKCVFYNLTPDERYLVYQIENNGNNRLEMTDLSTLEKTVIKEGDYNSLTIIGNRVFFREYGTDAMYYCLTEDPSTVHSFDPPDLTENKGKKGV